MGLLKRLVYLDWADIALHACGAVLMVAQPLFWWPWGLVPMVLASWLLREAAQRESHDLVASLKSLPQWSLQKQLEWIVPALAALAFIACWQWWRWT